MPTLMLKEIMEQPEALARSRMKNDVTAKAVAEEFKAKDLSYVYFVARGTSDHAGFFGKYLFESQLGIPFASGACSVVTLYGGKPNFKNAMIIAISQSGRAEDALAVIRCANEQGALTVAITNDESSPLASAAKFHLFCDAGIEVSVAATKTFTTEAQCLMQLAAEISGKNEIAQWLDQVPEATQKALELSNAIAPKAQKFKDMQACFVLGRGVAYPLAMEAALKTQETCYVSAKAFPISDFYHGPFAMVDEKTTVFVYAASGSAFKDAMEMIRKLKTTGCTTVVVSSEKEALALADCAFETPVCSNDFIQFFSFSVFAQLFAQHLSLAKGLNPDAPRGLKKVTITV